jgi:hypothetical protein
MMEAASTFETSVKFYQTTRRNNPKGSHLWKASASRPAVSGSNNMLYVVTLCFGRIVMGVFYELNFYIGHFN